MPRGPSGLIIAGSSKNCLFLTPEGADTSCLDKMLAEFNYALCVSLVSMSVAIANFTPLYHGALSLPFYGSSWHNTVIGHNEKKRRSPGTIPPKSKGSSKFQQPLAELYPRSRLERQQSPGYSLNICARMPSTSSRHFEYSNWGSNLLVNKLYGVHLPMSGARFSGVWTYRISIMHDARDQAPDSGHCRHSPPFP